MIYARCHWILLTATVAGCEHARPSVPDQPALRADLVADLHARAKNPKWKFTADSVKFHTQPSQAVPGLTYHWAEYKVPDQIPTRRFYTVAGVRGEQTRLLSTPRDWASLVSGWKARDFLAASTACKELLQITRLRQGAAVQPAAYDSTTAQTLLDLGVNIAELPKNALGDAHVARQDGGYPRWIVTAWYLLPGSAPELIKLVCEIPTRVAAESAPRITWSDSVAVPSQYQ